MNNLKKISFIKYKILKTTYSYIYFVSLQNLQSVCKKNKLSSYNVSCAVTKRKIRKMIDSFR